ncbi:MAG: SUMF1/EgtB/PvdO family nonheme iron enzyme [Planctomycetota bacterium]|jgi:acetoin utilization deacetylase AcuC-like enzyme/formylglycine-generating enzyme required for sulfatase activity
MTIPYREFTSKAFCLLIVLIMVSACRRVEDAAGTLEVIKTKTGIEMVKIPEGWFDMGSKGGSPDESPLHKVWINSFWMDRYEVVQEQFKKFQISDPSHFKDPNNPLEQINWTDATMFCNERSLAEGLEPCYDEETWECNFQANGYRLPTEAEWEYACRAGTRTNFTFGNDGRNLKYHAWFAENASEKTHLVGKKKSNPWGLYDMYGNVSEWCNDFYSENYYQNSDQKNPKGPMKGKERVLRGGAWNSSADSCRSSYRSSDPSIDDTCLASDAIGFRCVRNASDNKSPEENMVKDKQAREKSKTALVYDDIYLEHKTTPGHPETPRRLIAITEQLKEKGLYSQLVKLLAKPVPSEWLTMVHSPEYIQRVRKSCENNAGYLDSMDVPISAESYEAALVAAGGVLSAIDAVVEKKVTNAFCAIRPPGHHSLKDKAMGFCIFNNVAVGAKYIQKKHNLSDILIVDWDVHHGNGTQAMFYDDPSVLYFSTHQYPFYPGTGSEAEKGTGQGLNYNINVPLPIGSGDVDYVKVFKEKLEPAALAFSPDFVLISAGFDAHKDDLLGGMKVTAEGFAQLTQIVKDISEKCCEGRLVSVLEGGYGLEGLADSVEAHIRVLTR